MKVRSLFLLMCAIAALASCSKNDDGIPGGESDAPEAKVILKLEGDGVNTKVDEGPAPETGAAVDNVTVFFFNQSDFIVRTPKYVPKSELADLSVTGLKTTTDATKIVVIANLGKDLTGDTFKDVSSLSQLKKVDFSSITGDTGAKTVNQSAANLYSSGMAEITWGEDAGHADVQLHFVAAKIDKVQIGWLTASTNHYAIDEATLKGSDNKWFCIKRVYLMTAQTNSPLIPADAATDAWTGGFIPQFYGFAGGVAWGAGKWDWTDQSLSAPVQTNDYLVTSIPAAIDDGIADVLGAESTHKPWYVFENPEISGHKTGLVIEVLWRSKTGVIEERDYLTKYFTVYFGEKAITGSNPQPLIEAGKSYTMNIGLKGDFKPGGNAGGGGDDPTKPTVDAQVTVSVTAAKWSTVGLTKEFK